jgi:hypothetical protein
MLTGMAAGITGLCSRLKPWSVIICWRGMMNSIPSVMEAAQLQPDVILLESLTGSRFPNIIQQLREVCNAKVIIEYDDFLLNVPLKNGNR